MTPSLALVAAAAASLALVAVLARPEVPRRDLLVRGGVGLVAMTAIAVADSLDLVILTLLAAGVAFARLSGWRDFARRLQGPVFAAGVLALALVFGRVQGPELLAKLSAVSLLGGLAAGVGLLPWIHPRDPEAPAADSETLWIGFIGPVLAAAVLLRARQLLSPDADGELGAMLIGVGLLNLVWGTLATWWTRRDDAAWHYSFMADWGLALCGFGISVADGRSAALLVLFGIVLGRFPLSLAARRSEHERGDPDRPLNLLVAAMLAGSAPFAGFAARVLLLRGATEIYWPLAVALALSLLLWLPPSLRLGRSLSIPRGRQAFGFALILAVNAAIGLYPLAILSVSGP